MKIDTAYVEVIQGVEDYVSQIEEALTDELNRYQHSRFFGPLSYAFQGGKRLRPLLVLLSTNAIGGQANKALEASVAVELLHTESIIHDDIIDQELSRRTRLAFHMKYGYDASLLTADFVFGIILNIASRYDDPRVALELSSAALRMCEGEYDEMKIDPRVCRLSWEEYIKLIQKKTASLFEVAMKIGGIVGGASERDIHALSEYGLNLGTAYQIQDDLLDWGLEDKVAEALKLNSKDNGILEYLRHMSKQYAVLAKDSIGLLEDSDAKNKLLDLADFVILRTA
jgi:octaprenyl-diphosphate synthase